MKNKYGYSIANTTLLSLSTCNIPESDYFDLFRGLGKDMDWLGMTFGLAVVSVWQWCSDQVIVQRTLAAKNLEHAKLGCILAGYLKILPLFLIVLPGMIAKTLYSGILKF